MRKTNIDKLYSYLSVGGIIASIISVIILGTMRYAQVSFELDSLHKGQDKENKRALITENKLYLIDRKLDRLYQYHLSSYSNSAFKEYEQKGVDEKVKD